MADLTIRIRANAAEAQTAFREVATGLQGVDRAAAQVTRTNTAAAGSTANLAAQFQDIGVMLAAGQSPLLLAIQQGTQISAVLGASGGGAAGAAALLRGALASVISPVSLLTIAVIAGGAALVQWGMAALGAGDDAKTFEDRMKALEAAVKAHGDALENLRAPIGDAIADYGRLTTEVRSAQAAIEQLTRSAAQDEVAATAADIAARFGDLSAIFADLQEGGAAVERGFALGGLMEALDIMDAAEAEAVALAAALIDLGNASGPAEQAIAAQAVADALERAAGSTDNMSGAARQLLDDLAGLTIQAAEFQGAMDQSRLAIENAASALATMAGNMASNVSLSGALATNLLAVAQRAFAAAQALASARAAANTPAAGGPAGAPLAAVPDASWTDDGVAPGRPNARPIDIDFGYTPATGSGSRPSGGGSAGGVDRELQAAQREAERIIERNRTALEEYNAEVERVTELHEQGLLPLDQFNREMDRLGTELDEAQFGDFRKEIQGIAQDLGRAIVNSEGLGETFGNVIRDMAADLVSSGLESLMLSAFGPLFGGTSAGGGLGSLFSGIFGGFRANGGPVSAGTGYVVGERGPEFFVPSTSGMILPSGRGTSPAGAAQAAGMGAGAGVLRVIIDEAPGFAARVRTEAAGVAVEVVKAHDRALPDRVAQIQRHRRDR
jgi:hypothetical protein